MKATPIQMNEKFIADIRNIILSARTAAIRSIDFERVKMYWALGERIFCEEQDLIVPNTEPICSKIWPTKWKRSSAADFPIDNWRFADNFIELIQI